MFFVVASAQVQCGSGQYTFFTEDCPQPQNLEPLKPKTIPGTSEKAPIVLPSIDVLG